MLVVDVHVNKKGVEPEVEHLFLFGVGKAHSMQTCTHVPNHNHWIFMVLCENNGYNIMHDNYLD